MEVSSTHTLTLRLVLDRGCVGSVNLQPSVPSVSTLVWGSGVSIDTPPDGGKIPKERGRSLLRKQGEMCVQHVFFQGTCLAKSLTWEYSPCLPSIPHDMNIALIK